VGLDSLVAHSFTCDGNSTQGRHSRVADHFKLPRRHGSKPYRHLLSQTVASDRTVSAERLASPIS